MSKITKETLLSYDEKRLLIFTSTCVGVALIVGLIIGYLIPPSQNKINNQATIQNFNERHDQLLNSWDFQEFSDIDKVNYISGYKQGLNDGINRYNWRIDSLKFTKQLKGL